MYFWISRIIIIFNSVSFSWIRQVENISMLSCNFIRSEMFNFTTQRNKISTKSIMISWSVQDLYPDHYLSSNLFKTTTQAHDVIMLPYCFVPILIILLLIMTVKVGNNYVSLGKHYTEKKNSNFMINPCKMWSENLKQSAVLQSTIMDLNKCNMRRVSTGFDYKIVYIQINVIHSK